MTTFSHIPEQSGEAVTERSQQPVPDGDKRGTPERSSLGSVPARAHSKADTAGGKVVIEPWLERVLSGNSTLDDRRAFWKAVAKGRDGERSVLHLVRAGVRELSDPRLLELVTDEALSMERAVK